ncbi:MAG: glycoside hydrolase 43 family protein [Bacteroidales bacterium]|nr:glycoside hydrolase 43 family protein [Bacteroidales bacterium]
MRHLLCALALLIGFGTALQAKSVTTNCVNPLTYTDIPDNDVIRVGDDFYMISTTMYFCPGAPIMHSRDLVHWRIVNYVYDTLNDDDVYNLRNGRNAYGKGQWAASLRYHDGMYYVLFIANDQQKTYVYKTRDIQRGTWEKTVLDRVFHDASLLFDDGHVYLVYGNGDLRIAELKPDLSGVQPGGVDQVLISAPRNGYSLRAEGAHFYHIGDYYYVIEIDWPSGGVRTETCWRSKQLLGPYESKIILQGAFDGRGDGVAQGAIFDTPAGDWYAVMFQDHGAVGRIPTLQPLTWEDGWPVLGDRTVPVKTFDVNLKPYGENYVWDSDEFRSKRNQLALVWQWNHMPDDAAWSLTERKGWLRLRTAHVATGVMDARNSLTQRTVGPRCVSEVRMDVSGMKPGDRAGLCAFQSNYASIGVEMASDGRKELVALTRVPGNGRRDGGAERITELLRKPLQSDIIYLKITYIFTPQRAGERADTAFLSYSEDGHTWHLVEGMLQMRYTLDLFTGYRSMLYNYATATTGGHVDFDYYRQTAF